MTSFNLGVHSTTLRENRRVTTMGWTAPARQSGPAKTDTSRKAPTVANISREILGEQFPWVC